VFSDEDGALRETLYSLKARDCEPKQKGEEGGKSRLPRE